MDKEKVTLKDYGFSNWFFYHIENDTLIGIIIKFGTSIIVGVITAIIVSNNIVSSNNRCDTSNNNRANNVEQQISKNIN